MLTVVYYKRLQKESNLNFARENQKKEQKTPTKNSNPIPNTKSSKKKRKQKSSLFYKRNV